MGKQTGQGKALRTWHKYRLFRPSVPLYGALPVPAKQLRTFAPRKPHSRRLHQGCLTTHTPQGDGNAIVRNTGLQLFPYNPHPARGRKPLYSYASGRKYTLQPTPRKGTETSATAGGCQSTLLQPTPRKGTETFFPETKASAAKITTHTPQGDGNHNRYLFLCFFVITTHTPQGDGNPHWCDSVHFF